MDDYLTARTFKKSVFLKDRSAQSLEIRLSRAPALNSYRLVMPASAERIATRCFLKSEDFDLVTFSEDCRLARM